MAFSRLVFSLAGACSRNLQLIGPRNALSCYQKRQTPTFGSCRQVIRFTSSQRQSLRVNVNGVDFHCEKTGSGDHVVLLLPGALGSSKTDYDPQLEKMNKVKFTIFSFDPRGYGKSIPPERDWPLEYLQRDAEDAAAVMKTLVDKKFSVLGWSDGGITGMILTARYPDLVKKLVIWGANSYISDQDMKMIRAVEDLEKWSPRMKQPYIDTYGEEYFRSQWSNFVKAYGNYFTQRKGDLCTDDLKNITCPTFILHGDKDLMVDTVHPAHLNKLIQNSRLHRMPEGKHNIHLKYVDEFNKLVEDFLEE